AAAALAGGLSWGAAAALGSPRFARAHALALAALVAMGPLLRAHADPHSLLARPHNLLEARLVSSAGGWTALLAGGLLVAAWPLARPGGGRRGALLRAGGRLAPPRAPGRAAAGPGVRALSPVWLGAYDDAQGPRRPGARGAGAEGWREDEGPRRPGTALCLLFLLNVGLLLLWHGLLAATLAYRHDWAGNAAGAALGWAAWALTYRLWYRCPCSPGRPGLGLQPR
ncbi:fat storage-inducing transmembrane protein 1-like, partial [Rhea pennata]|uniref:fat storage-inducing transmembrane protein 1-like n=1 Tax=Rhea pennata TaxID=8795 RepID=UPI002E2534AD